MSNIFVSLPAPAANASGAAVDMSAFGVTKTVTVVGNGGVFEPFVLIEISNDIAGARWAPVVMFQKPAEQTFDVACRWMRATVSKYRGGGAPTVEVGGTDDGTKFATLIAPSGDGVGLAVDVSTLGLFKTVQLADPFRGAVNIEVSEDGGATFAQSLSFSAQGQQSKIIAADFLRVSRNGVPLVAPGIPLVNIAAANPSSSGGGGGGNRKVFRHTVTLAESLLASFPIILPAARANVSYNAEVTGGGLTNQVTFDTPVTLYLLTQFTVVPSGLLTAGDVLLITVEDLT